MVHCQMQAHFIETATEYEAHITKGFHTLRSGTYASEACEGIGKFQNRFTGRSAVRDQIHAFRNYTNALFIKI